MSSIRLTQIAFDITDAARVEFVAKNTECSICAIISMWEDFHTGNL
jgi:hypothetical protein